MAANNKYYIIPTALPSEIKAHIVGGGLTSRTNKNGTKAVAKRFMDDNEDRPQFNAFIEYTRDEILIELEKPEWQIDEE